MPELTDRLPLGHLEGTRYPDPRVESFDKRFPKQGNAAIERIATGFRWAEGPVYFGDGGYLLWSDIPNNRMMRWLEENGEVSVFRAHSHHSNGNTRDRQGRHGAAHRGMARSPNVEGIDLGRADEGDRDDGRACHDEVVGRLARRWGQALGIVHAPREPARVEDDGRRADRARERTPADLVDAGDGPDAAALQRAFPLEVRDRPPPFSQQQRAKAALSRPAPVLDRSNKRAE